MQSNHTTLRNDIYQLAPCDCHLFHCGHDLCADQIEEFRLMNARRVEDRLIYAKRRLLLDGTS
jgi:hypothetical protein